MSRPLRAALIALLSVFAVAACVRSPDSAQSEHRAVAAPSAQPESVAPRDYYGRTTFEIPGGDGQVVDYSNG